MREKLTYSLVMLVEDAESDFTPYLLEIHDQLDRLRLDHELVLAINGPGLFAQACLQKKWPVDGPTLQIVELTRKVPSGTCLKTVLPECRGEYLIVCGPYRQISDSGLQALIEAVSEGKADLALPWRRERVDPAVNQWQSRCFNWLVRHMTETPYQDLSSTLRVMRRQVLEETTLYGDLYRYLPLQAKRRGFQVRELPATHAEERGKVGYYGLREYVSRLVDLLAMCFILGFARKPLRYFGLRGIFLLLIGLVTMTAALILKLTGVGSLGNSPLLMIGLVLMLAGSTIWGIGLLGEILTFALGRKRKDYIIETVLG